jgi:hypothetical protein
MIQAFDSKELAYKEDENRYLNALDGNSLYFARDDAGEAGDAGIRCGPLYVRQTLRRR